jgi:hypothetical protein
MATQEEANRSMNAVIDGRDEIRRAQEDEIQEQREQESMQKFIGIRYCVSGRELKENYQKNIDRVKKRLASPIKLSVEEERFLENSTCLNQFAIDHLDSGYFQKRKWYQFWKPEQVFIESYYYLDLEDIRNIGIAMPEEADSAPVKPLIYGRSN